MDRCIVDHAQDPVIALGNAPQRMRQRRVRAISFCSFRLGEHTHYPSSLDAALSQDTGGVLAEPISRNFHRSLNVR